MRRRVARGKRPAAGRRPCIEVIVESREWRRRVRNVTNVVRRAAGMALAAGRRPGAEEVCLVLADDARSRRLNRTWRGQDKPTNVLSFPADEPRRSGPRSPAGAPFLLGDVVVACGVAASEAAAQGKPLGAHLAHLIVHGVLHLLGHDHRSDPEAARMEALETRILRRLGVADPYRVPQIRHGRRAA